MAFTKIRNTFRIRHAEASQENLGSPEQVGYLFGRLFAFIRMVPQETERGDWITVQGRTVCETNTNRSKSLEMLPAGRRATLAAVL